MCVCIGVCMWVHEREFMYMRVCMCLHVCVHTCTHACIYVCVIISQCAMYTEHVKCVCSFSP